MEIHKPRPIHSWRDFLSEMTVIVLGILIALGGEQLIETWHWHHQAEEAEVRLTRELGANVAAAIVRLRTAPCVEQRLDVIAAALGDAANSGTLPPMGDLGRPPVYLWGHGTWDSAVASQTTTHFPAERLANFAVAYQLISRLGDITQRELEVWSDVWSIVGPGRRFDSSADAARLAVGRARLLSREIDLMSQSLVERFKALDLPPQRTARAEELDRGIRQPIALYEICQPIGKRISPVYGESPLEEVAPPALSDLPHLYK